MLGSRDCLLENVGIAEDHPDKVSRPDKISVSARNFEDRYLSEDWSDIHQTPVICSPPVGYMLPEFGGYPTKTLGARAPGRWVMEYRYFGVFIAPGWGRAGKDRISA